MKINIHAVLANLAAMWRADHDLLVRTVSLFVFVPQLAAFLLRTEAPVFTGKPDDQAAVQAFVERFMDWLSVNAPLNFSAGLLCLFGGLVVLMLYLDDSRPQLSSALLSALRLLPRYFLVALIVSVPEAVSLMAVLNPLLVVLIVPALYLSGRWMLAAPILVAERPVGAFEAVRRSFAMTRGNGMVMMAIAGIMILGTQMLVYPFLAIGGAMDGAPNANPVVKALLDAMAAAAVTAGLLATILAQVSLYSWFRLTSRGT